VSAALASGLMGLEVAWLEEQEGNDARGCSRLLGLFTARLERARDEGRRVEIERVQDVRIDGALAWARARAGLVLVRFGRRTEFWSAGATPHWSYPAWPPHDLPPLIERPSVEEDWRTAPPEESVHWAVTFWLRPGDLGAAGGIGVRQRWDSTIAVSAAAAGLGWDAECLENHLADRAEAGGRAYSTAWPPEYRVYCVARARDRLTAERQAKSRFDPPAGFHARSTVRPADVSESGPVQRGRV
jgi:hypothetical protein